MKMRKELLFGFAIMNLFHGALSDSFGRRPVVLAGLAVFTLASVGCALSHHIGALVFFRALQGMSAGAGIVVSRAVIRDMFPPADAQRVMSQVTIYFGVAPAVAPMIVVSCAIGAYAIQNAMFDIWLMLGFGVVGYVLKKIGIPLAPFTLALVLGNRAEDAFRLSMIGAGGDLKVFWSNGLVGFITTLAIVLLFWPLIDKAFGSVGRLWRPAKAPG